MMKTALFVDDDTILSRALQRYVHNHEDAFALLVAQNGAEALDVLKDNTVSLVVTDLQMPVMDGFELLAQMTRQYPEIPVIIVTAFSTEETRRKGLSEGAIGFIEKPVPVEDFSVRISDALEAQVEGGEFQNVPLETMAQLIGMESKSCKLRVKNKQSGERGVLFFSDGEIITARYEDLEGIPAAVNIFQWDYVQMDIENVQPVADQDIDGGLEAVLELVAQQRT